MNSVQYYRTLVIINGAVPAILLAWDAVTGSLGANPVNHALHISGMLALIFLLLSLAITPLRLLTGWGGWIAQRRGLGLYAFFYAVLHLTIYVTFDRQLKLSSVLEEVWLRRFLQFGALSLLLMLPLAITSTNAMQRRMGAQRWRRLHRLAYPIAILAVMHYGLSVKSDMRLPIALSAVLTILFALRFWKSSAKPVRKRAAPGSTLPTT